MRRVAVLALLVVVGPLSAGPESAAAQAVVPDPGEEVRVVQRGVRGAVHGLYVEATPQEIRLQSIEGGGPIRILRDAITGMSVQRGQRSQALKGSMFGIGLGVAAGIVLGQVSDRFETGEAVGISVGAAVPLGLIIGLLMRSPEWDGVDMPELSPRPDLRDQP